MMRQLLTEVLALVLLIGFLVGVAQLSHLKLKVTAQGAELRQKINSVHQAVDSLQDLIVSSLTPQLAPRIPRRWGMRF